MINKILIGIISLISSLVNVILSPIDSIITANLPGLSSALNSFSTFLGYISNGIGWVIDSFAIPSAVISLIVAYYIFKLTVPLLIYTIKLIIKWYDKLKP